MPNGYAGKILRVDLTAGKCEDIDSSKYLPEYIGGVSLGWRLLWDETNATTTEWSPENPLIFCTGPAAGSPIPTSSRLELIGIAPSGFPYPWAAASGAGGDFSVKLKWCGYDAVIVTGKSSKPVYIYIDDNGPSILDGASLWGTGSQVAQQRLMNLYGTDIAALAIGQAGENKTRIATIETNTENSFGQGGFGAVMGDKNCKAICVKPGNHKITWANPEEVIRVTKKISYEMGPVTANGHVSLNTTAVSQDFGSYTARRLSCAYSNCQTNAHDCLYWSYNRVPSTRGYGQFSSTCGCSGGNGISGGVLPTGQPRNVTMELHNLECNWGINTWGNTYGGMITYAYQQGMMTQVNGIPLNSSGRFDTVDQVIQFFRDVVNRTGPEGDIWAEGGARAAEALGLHDISWRFWKHGYGTHWDGRNQGNRFPMWVGAALSWAIWPRDPFNDSHGWVERTPWYVLEWGGKGGTQANKDMTGRDAIPFADLIPAAAKLYGTTGVYQGNNCPDALSGWPGVPDDTLGYKDKEYTMFWHHNKELFKNSVVVCDAVLPLLYNSEASDKLGYYFAEEEAFNACTGANWSFAKCQQQGERILNMMRAFIVRQGRTREHDESVIRYFTEIETSQAAEKRALDPVKFVALLERYYTLVGWDVKTGWPTRAKLESLGLKDIADKLAEVNKLP